MIEEIINNACLIASGHKLFNSEQKPYIVEYWQSSNMTRLSSVNGLHKSLVNCIIGLNMLNGKQV